MAGAAKRRAGRKAPAPRPATRDPRWVMWLLMAVAFGFLGLFVVLPLTIVFVEAFREGFGPFADALAEPDTLAALQLSLLTVALAVPLNIVFGIAAAWIPVRMVLAHEPTVGLLDLLVGRFARDSEHLVEIHAHHAEGL